MKRVLIIGIVVMAVLGIGQISAQAQDRQISAQAQSRAGRVFCNAPTSHRVVCYNFTDWAVHMNVTVWTSNGVRRYNFWNYRTRWVRYISSDVQDVGYSWWF
jgi:hypothetical protein